MNGGGDIRFIDLFSGIGGFRLGLERTGGFRCVWSCDNNKYANQVYTRRFGKENHYTGDVRGVDPAGIPDFDLLCAGFPCQSFSVAGKRKGFKDTRGTLFFEICRIAEAKRPPLLLLENVKGLLNHDRGRTFTVVLQSLDELGYWVEWQVLNSKRFGVPQNRERVFIIGHLRGTGGREVFPITEPNPVSNKTNNEKVAGVTLANFSRYSEGNIIRTPIQSEGISWALNSAGDQGVAIYRHPFNYGKKSLYNTEETYPALRTVQRNPQPKAFHENIGKHISIRDEAVALRSGASHSYQGIIKGTKIRRLTPIECERLQGFPDGWTEGISDTQRYKCLGNAVTVNVIEFLGKKLLEAVK